jgi:hypothetical protein
MTPICELCGYRYGDVEVDGTVLESIALINCGHHFHEKCLEELEGDECPICSTGITWVKLVDYRDFSEELIAQGRLERKEQTVRTELVTSEKQRRDQLNRWFLSPRYGWFSWEQLKRIGETRSSDWSFLPTRDDRVNIYGRLNGGETPITTITHSPEVPTTDSDMLFCGPVTDWVESRRLNDRDYAQLRSCDPVVNLLEHLAAKKEPFALPPEEKLSWKEFKALKSPPKRKETFRSRPEKRPPTRIFQPVRKR